MPIAKWWNPKRNAATIQIIFGYSISYQHFAYCFFNANGQRTGRRPIWRWMGTVAYKQLQYQGHYNNRQPVLIRVKSSNDIWTFIFFIIKHSGSTMPNNKQNIYYLKTTMNTKIRRRLSLSCRNPGFLADTYTLADF